MSNLRDLPHSRLLIIDADTEVAEHMRPVAEATGFDVGVCNSFDSLEATLKGCHPQLIFLELRLPGHDGVEVLELLAKTKCHSRIFLMSDIEQSILDSACRIGQQLQLDIAGSLRKPFEKKNFEGILACELDTRSRFTTDDFQTALGPGEFIIQYHPIIVVSADRDAPIVGVEVRPYWKNKHGSRVYLSQTLPRIRESKLVHEFNFMLMDKALESYGEWLKSGLDLGITVGMDESNLSDTSWPDFMTRVVDKWNVPHDRITIALQQQAIKNNIDSVVRVLTRLRISGFKIALETMGNDIKDLDEILQIPFSELRLRRSLVDRIGQSMEAEFHVSTLISLAKKRNIMTCAVGVKSAKAFTFLQDCGCTTATGSLFGQSLPVTQVENFVRYS